MQKRKLKLTIRVAIPHSAIYLHNMLMTPCIDRKHMPTMVYLSCPVVRWQMSNYQVIRKDRHALPFSFDHRSIYLIDNKVEIPQFKEPVNGMWNKNIGKFHGGGDLPPAAPSQAQLSY